MGNIKEKLDKRIAAGVKRLQALSNEIVEGEMRGGSAIAPKEVPQNESFYGQIERLAEALRSEQRRHFEDIMSFSRGYRQDYEPVVAQTAMAGALKGRRN